MSETSGQYPEAQIMAQLVGLPLIKVNSIFNFLLNGSKLDIIHLQNFVRITYNEVYEIDIRLETYKYAKKIHYTDFNVNTPLLPNTGHDVIM